MKSEPSRGRGGGWLELVTGLARLVLASRQQRRQLLFFLMSAVLVQIFLGVFVIEGWLTGGDHPLAFLGYWGLCLAATGFAFLLAFYDLLAVRRDFRAEARRRSHEAAAGLAREIREAKSHRDGDDPDEGAGRGESGNRREGDR